uniref:Uncharacterized protein n=1 Tax=Panagrellus redivivus TaxID=6233 RepID=A0A7E4ZXM7_PANRE
MVRGDPYHAQPLPAKPAYGPAIVSPPSILMIRIPVRIVVVVRHAYDLSHPSPQAILLTDVVNGHPPIGQSASKQRSVPVFLALCQQLPQESENCIVGPHHNGSLRELGSSCDETFDEALWVNHDCVGDGWMNGAS